MGECLETRAIEVKIWPEMGWQWIFIQVLWVWVGRSVGRYNRTSCNLYIFLDLNSKIPYIFVSG